MAPPHDLTVVTRSVYESSVAAEVARTGEELSSCLRLSSLDQWIGRGSQLRPVFVMALRMVSSLRMQAVRAVFTAAPALRRVMAGPGVYLATSPATADALRSLGAVDVRLAP